MIVPFDDVVGKTKRCVKCQQDLPLSKFSMASGGSYLRPECRECAKDLTTVRKTLKRLHGHPEPSYACPICGRQAHEVKGAGGAKLGAWVIDHCHETNTFRGWLCHNCNRGLGTFSTVDILEKAKQYLQR